MKIFIASALAFALAACQHTGPATITGACEAFPAPKHIIRGANKPSQRWIDTTIERGIAVCNWPRPRVLKP